MNDLETLVTCNRCGRTILLSASSEAGLVAMGAMVEYYHCADREACNTPQRNRRDHEEQEIRRAETLPRLLMIVPATPAGPVPIIDDLTRRMTAAWRTQQNSGYGWRGSHVCICGVWSDSHDHYVGEYLTNSLCVHYLAYHRDAVPLEEVEKVRALTCEEAHPSEAELKSPKRTA